MPEPQKLIIEAGRTERHYWAILGGDVRTFWPGFLISNGLVLLFLVTGIWYFRRTEKTFADVI